MAVLVIRVHLIYANDLKIPFQR